MQMKVMTTRDGRRRFTGSRKARIMALIIGWLLDVTGGNWTLVFLLLAASRLLSAGVMAAVKA